MTEQQEYQTLLQKEQALLTDLTMHREEVKAIENHLREVREQLGYLQIQAPALKSA